VKYFISLYEKAEKIEPKRKATTIEEEEIQTENAKKQKTVDNKSKKSVAKPESSSDNDESDN